jgi:hypothetical protein
VFMMCPFGVGRGGAAVIVPTPEENLSGRNPPQLGRQLIM